MSTARTAADAAGAPWPRPSITPNNAASSSMLTAIGWSPETSSPGSGRPAVAHSIGPNRPPKVSLSCTGWHPFPHLDDRPSAGRGLDQQPVHQAAGAGQAHSQPAAGRVTVLHRALEVRDAGAVVLGAHDQSLAAVPVGHPDANPAANRVTRDV